MIRLLLGMLVGAAAAAAYMNRSSSRTAGWRGAGRGDELTTAAHNPVADPALDTGDATPSRTTTGV